MSILNVNKINPIGGGSTVTIAGIASVTGNITATTFVGAHSGSGANLTSLPAANLTGSLPAISGANLTNVSASSLSGNPSINTTGIVTATAFIPTTGQLSHRNLLINGEMKINQRVQTGTLGYFNPVTGSIYTLDRWKVLNAQSFDTDSAQVTQDNGAPSSEGFAKSIMMNIGNTETPGANNVCGFEQKIEAQDLQHLCYGTSSAKTLTLSFWVYSNKTGTYCVQVEHDDASKYNMYEYTINSSNTWEKKTITISGNQSNIINNDNGIGLGVNWILCAGSGRHVAATDSWASGASYYATSNQVNLWDHADNYFKMTGCQLEVGSVATPYEHRKLSEELLLCQRYFFNVTGDNGNRPGIPAFANSSSTLRAQVVFPTAMRQLPSVSGSATNMVFDSSDDSSLFLCSAVTAGGGTTNANPTRMVVEANPGGMTAGQGGHLEFRASNGVLNFDAEL